MNGKHIYAKYLNYASVIERLVVKLNEITVMSPDLVKRFPVHLVFQNLTFVYIKTLAVITSQNEVLDKDGGYGSVKIEWFHYPLKEMSLSTVLTFYKQHRDLIASCYQTCEDHRLYELDFKFLKANINQLRGYVTRMENELLGEITVEDLF